MDGLLRVEGGKPLRGHINVRGAKNLVPKAMVAALLGDTPSVISNVPHIRDVEVVSGLLRVHGATVDFDAKAGVLSIDPSAIETASSASINAHAGSSRIPILFCGPLLHRLGRATIPDLGGCHIGDRPVNFHLEILRRFGAKVDRTDGALHLTTNGRRLQGTTIDLPYPSVGATEQTLLTAVRAEGKTVLTGAAVEPEIIDLIDVLQKMGAIISVDTDRTITIEGVDALEGFNHRAIPDRIEAGSWACAALTTGGDITVLGARQTAMSAFLNVFRKVGGAFEVKEEGIRFYHPGGELHSMAM